MSSCDKKESRRTKLSLKKRSSENKAAQKTKEKVQSVLSAVVDLNETCEFREPVSFGGATGNSRRGNRDTAAGSSRSKEGTNEFTSVRSKTDTIQEATGVSFDRREKGQCDDGLEKEQEVVRCQVCNKSLSHMNTQRRQQHVNRCIDKSVEKEQADRDHERLLEMARTAVLDCPMCGKAFKADLARLSHLKKCSQALGVTTENLLKLTRDQEAERLAMLDKGILPDSMRNLKVKTAAQSKKRKAKEPKSQFEEDVQIAMAISTSMAEQEKAQTGELFGKNISDTGTSNKGQKTKRGKKRPLYEEVCLLTTLSETDKQRRLEEKVNNILVNEDLQDWNSKDSHPGVKLKDSELQSSSASDYDRSLWGKSLQSPDEGSIEMFYVSSLVPPIQISASTVSSKAKRAVVIPGREETFIEEKPERTIKYPMTSSGDDIITASTQTAVVLAELAVDDTGLHSSLESPDSVQPPESQGSGYCVQTLVLKEEDRQQEQSSALQAYRQLVNNPDSSDVKIITTDGQTLNAHRLILSVRCPQLLKLETSSTIDLPASSDLALSLLNYIYTGELNLTASKTEMEKLANQLELSPLTDLCKKLVSSNENADDLIENEDKAYGEEELTESKLDLKLIWGESDTDSESEENKQQDGGYDTAVPENLEVDDEDYHDIMCTQRRRLSASKNEDIENNRDDDSKDNNDNCDDEELIEKLDTGNVEKLVTHQLAMIDEDDTEIDLSINEGIKCKTSHDTDKLFIEKDKHKESAYETRKDVSDLNGELMCSIVVSSDDEITVPSPKRVRMSENNVEPFNDSKSESMADKAVENIDASDKELMETTGGDLAPMDVDPTGGDLTPMDVDPEHGNINSSISERKECSRNVSVGSFNQSGADLFGSPTPIKHNEEKGFASGEDHMVTDTSEIVTNGGKSALTDGNVKRRLQVVPTASTPVLGNSIEDSVVLHDSDSEELETDMNSTPRTINYKKESERNDETFREEFSALDKDLKAIPKSCLNETRDISDYNADENEDDLEITGDNFGELSKGSPLFIGKRFNRSSSSQNKTALCEIDGAVKHDTVFVDVDDVDSQEDVDQYFNESFNNEIVDLNLSVDEGSADSSEPGKLAVASSPVQEVGKVSEIDSSVGKNSGDNEGAFAASPGESIDGEIILSQDEAVKHISTSDKSMDGADGEAVDLITEDSGEGDVETIPANNTDVWEDFDDEGIGYVPPVESPGAASNLDDEDSCELGNSSFQNMEDSFVFQAETELLKSSTISKSKDTFITPTVKESKKPTKHPWVAPSPFTPMPQYDKMATPVIKKAVQKYGMKPVGKKRMIKVLQDIYHQTHQYETDSECEDLEDTEKSTKNTSDGIEDDGELGEDSDPACSQEQLSDQDSDTSDGGNIYEESCLHMVSSGSESSSPQKSADVNRQIFNYIKKNSTLHKRVLMYDPLELDVLKADLKEAKIKCSMDTLMSFLDERCIAFTTKNVRSGRRGKQKKGSPKKKRAASKSPKKRAAPKSPKKRAPKSPNKQSKSKSSKTGTAVQS